MDWKELQEETDRIRLSIDSAEECLRNAESCESLDDFRANLLDLIDMAKDAIEEAQSILGELPGESLQTFTRE